MKTINEIRAFTATPEYGKTFWNAMRIKHNAEAEMHDAMSATTGAFCAPAADETDFRKAIFAESVIRPLATELKKHTGGDVIWARIEHYAGLCRRCRHPRFRCSERFHLFPGCYAQDRRSVS